MTGFASGRKKTTFFLRGGTSYTVRSISREDLVRFTKTPQLSLASSLVLLFSEHATPMVTLNFVNVFEAAGMLFVGLAALMFLLGERGLAWREVCVFVIACWLLEQVSGIRSEFATIPLAAIIGISVIALWGYVYDAVTRYVWEPAFIALSWLVATAIIARWQGTAVLMATAFVLLLISIFTYGWLSYSSAEYERGFDRIPYD